MNNRILLLMSGGVDSSVAAVLLQRRGFEVLGITMNQIDSLPVHPADGCCSRQAIRDARAVADKLGVPHCAVNTMKEFDRKVIQPFIKSYKAGLTPNPCVHCNSYVRFEEAFELARERGCGGVATGHYARLVIDAGGAPHLFRAVYREKDQSYFLHGVRRDLLAGIHFPLGEITKDEVRSIAREIGLATAEKPDSQEICFTAGRTYNEFLADRLDEKEGPILDRQGNRLGAHRGLSHYTVGQRKGIGLTNGPFYVCRIDPRRNAVIVGRKEDLAVREVRASGARWITPPRFGERVLGQIRSRHTPAPAAVTSLDKFGFAVQFDEPQYGAAPGQALVLSRGDEILGGGMIVPPKAKEPPAGREAF
ncbi:MAG: tRNA 2-thiouridine(34) synthase MnmA [Candidatus Omnitrophica bacterium]|nr:tRNA 2-thiouridine(34) synthase MnmA [Candidatus Omnitrophota bacterium]